MTDSVRSARSLSAAEVANLQRRTLRVVVLSQVFGGAGLAAGITVGGLLAEDMLGWTGVAGLPTALFTLGAALAAFNVGRLSQRAGRRVGLGTGFLVGALGAAAIVVAAVADNVPLLFVGLFVYGSGTATNLQARYAGTDLAPPQARATAVSIALVSTTLGAVAGPNLVGVTGDLADRLDIPRLAGPFLLAGVAYAAAGLVLVLLLRPDPLLLARTIAADRATSEDGPSETEAPAGSPRGVFVGAATMVLTQITMVAIMTMTPVHMRHHGHGLGQVGFVIGLHIAAMYLPSLITGRLVDRLGRITMAAAAGATLLLAGVVAALSPGDSVVALAVALMLLGLGWNFGLISGTALLVDVTTLTVRARVQGNVDVLISLAGAGGGALSGVVVGASSYAALSIGGGLLALLLIPVVVWYQRPVLTDS